MVDWFRKTSWSPAIEQEFFRRLARARPINRREYMFIQLLTLMQTDGPGHANDVLRVLDRYPTDAEVGAPAEPVIYDDERMCFLFLRADARRRARDLPGAIADYREMAVYLRPRGRLGTMGEEKYFARMVLEEELHDLFEEALDLLSETSRALDNPFPKHRFEASLASARLAHRLGRAADASLHAKQALHETTVTRTELRNHRHLGLVQSLDPGVLDELRWLADPASRH